MTTPQLTQAQLNALLLSQYDLYLLQGSYGVGDALKPAMDAVQKQARALAQPHPDVLAQFDARPSQWAKWMFWDSACFVPLQDRLVAQGWDAGAAYTAINSAINFWRSTINMQGKNNPDGTFSYLAMNGQWYVDDDRHPADAEAAKYYGGPLPAEAMLH